MKIKKNGKVITLTESDLNRIVKRVLKETKLNEGTLLDVLGKEINWEKAFKYESGSLLDVINEKPATGVKFKDLNTAYLIEGGEKIRSSEPSTPGYVILRNFRIIQNPNQIQIADGQVHQIETFDKATGNVTFKKGFVVGPK